MITELRPNQIFVFGSNLAGDHIGGSALQAHKDFGADWGIGEGLTGQAYAFPTLTKNMKQRGLKGLEKSRDWLYRYAGLFPELEFLLTPVGTGIAGYDYDTIDKLFINIPCNIKKVGWNYRNHPIVAIDGFNIVSARVGGME